MENLKEMASVLVGASDARAAATGVLDHLMRVSVAPGGAVIALPHATMSVFVHRNLDLQTAGIVHERILAWRGQLERGVPVNLSFLRLSPILSDGALRGVLYLERPLLGIPEKTAEWAIVVLAAAMAHDRQPDGGHLSAYLDGLRSTNIERETLIHKLQSTTWNVKRVAEEMGVTRRTIYLRMQKYGIPRQKPPKTLKPKPA